MDYKLAMAIFHDAASLNMRKAGRTWSEDDYNAGIEALNRCLHDEFVKGLGNA